MGSLYFVRRAAKFQNRVALLSGGKKVTYATLLNASASAATVLLKGATDLHSKRVAFLTPRDWSYPVVQWASWQAGAIAVPLCEAHPAAELEYVLKDADAEIVVAHPAYADRLEPLARRQNCRFLLTEDLISHANLISNARSMLPLVEAQREAMIVYTSGTTGKPKGAVSTHANIEAQVTGLVQAWGWSETDHILHVLPLHHVHGIVNVLACSLWSGATCSMMPKFNANGVWEAFERGQVNVFMAVPTIYSQLIAAYDRLNPEHRAKLTRACSAMRLMVSGSAALPIQTFEKWRKITGHSLLERYGMTELGMVLSNPLHGERRPGFVGSPLPGVEVRIVDEKGRDTAEGVAGELWVRGPNVFQRYFAQTQATRNAFANDWFRTGDIAQLEHGSYRILGRRSVDIIKSGGYKVSALEVEGVLRDHPAIAEVAVVGIEDETWGQRVCAAIVVASGESLSMEQLRDWGKERMAAYKVPTLLKTFQTLPRNVLGKVLKPELIKCCSR